MNNGKTVNTARSLMHKVYEFLVVSKCPSCHAVTRHSGVFCKDCLIKYEKERDEKCPYCKMPAVSCVCSTRDLKFCSEFGKSLHSYTFYIKENKVLTGALYSLKRSPDRNSEKLFARELAAELLKLAAANNVDLSEWIITFPPRGRRSVLTYGFDQAKGLAKRVSKLTGAQYKDVFLRKGSKNQKKLNAFGRLENAAHSFSIKKNVDINDKKFIIIDDIVTTGATVGACEKLLIRNSKEVFVLSISKTVKIGKGYDRKEEERKKPKKDNLWFNS